MNNSKLFAINEKWLCYCDNNKTDCNRNELGPLYPGQTVTASLRLAIPKLSTEIIVETDANQTYFTPCIVHNPEQIVQFLGTTCTTLNYMIAFPTNSWCELFLRVPLSSCIEYNVFYIRQLPCPLGFTKINNVCKCYSIFKMLGIDDCDVNKQAILRPAHSWILVLSHENIYASKDCLFYYCKTTSSYLNVSTPDLQCQFERCGILCGHCKQGFSTVFGSSHCQRRSNIFLLLIIPIGIAGLLLVLLLFLLNLTVTDGSINTFILYVNIISINSTVFSPHQNTVSPIYIFISLANLDLGIQTCFYNGMDDYAKMWLQLTFPFYLIFLATLLIITSRYSATIQRLTANRVLSVLATLFLLSYTKILRTVSMVLFFYSSITHLPSQHTAKVWSVDANIPLFGVKFTIIFIVCLVLFLILVPFNVILLFTRALSRFNVINKFKPLLDAYQGPYRHEFYYWTGMQLALRAVYFGISSLDKRTNFTAGMIIFIIASLLSTACQPFKSKFKNYQELFLYLNQVILYTFALSSSQSDIRMTAVNAMVCFAAIHFGVIVMHHIFTYVLNSAIKDKLSLGINKYTDLILQIWNRLLAKIHNQQFELQNNTAHLNIPNVTYNYQEYQEPLLESDYCK